MLIVMMILGIQAITTNKDNSHDNICSINEDCNNIIIILTTILKKEQNSTNVYDDIYDSSNKNKKELLSILFETVI